jgi:hypothetical protein
LGLNVKSISPAASRPAERISTVPEAPPVGFITWKLSNVKPPHAITVLLVTGLSTPVLIVQGKVDALATLSESNEKANNIIFFIAFSFFPFFF